MGIVHEPFDELLAWIDAGMPPESTQPGKASQERDKAYLAQLFWAHGSDPGR